MLNEALRQIRAFHQMKQSDLAIELDISNSYLSEIESGRKSISLELLEKYSEIFDIPVSSLLLFAENINSKKPSDTFRLKFAKKIIKIMEWASMCDEVKLKTKA